MLNKKSQWLQLCFVTATIVAFASGCSPSTQPPTEPDLGKGVVQSSGFSELQQAIQIGEQSGKYKIKSDVKLSQGTMHTDFSVYGSVNLPDRASLSFHENNFSISFYQQGQSAYSLMNSQWSQTAPISDLDVFPAYARLLGYISQSGVPVYQLKTIFDIDQNCHVYQVTVPGSQVAGLSMWGSSFKVSGLSDLTYTFFIGTKNHMLVEVQTQSAGAISGLGSVVVNSDTVLFDQGQVLANIQIPNDLVKQLENQS